MAGGMQMTWDDWNPYLGVDYPVSYTHLTLPTTSRV